MKIHIAYNPKSGPWGGGNQFLKALSAGLQIKGAYGDSLDNADAVIFNSYNDMWMLAKASLFGKKKCLAYRLGPIFHTYRKGFKWKLIDRMTIFFANLFADIIIFQSEWSFNQALKLGLSKKKKYAIVLNAVNTSLFHKKEYKEKISGEKIKLVYTSWSSNMKKGFKYLKFLDENLDFSKYDFTFIGNSPFEFKNIKILKPLPSRELGEKICENDIFVSPVEDDACSNALLEGLASGLPAVALRSGGNPELVGGGGELFSNESELLEKIGEVANRLKFYYDSISVKSIEKIAEEYINAIKKSC